MKSEGNSRRPSGPRLRHPSSLSNRYGFRVCIVMSVEGYAAHGLSDIPLGWMMGKAAAAGLVFDPKLASLYPPLDTPSMLSNPKLALDVIHRVMERLMGISPDTLDCVKFSLFK